MKYDELKQWIFSDEFKDLYRKFNPELRKCIRHQFARLPSGGAGNHFCEIQKDENDNVWIMLHFGSRNLGQQLGRYYNNVAKEQNLKWRSCVAKEYDLAFLPVETSEAQEYISALNLCKVYAESNHDIAMEEIKAILKQKIDGCEFLDHYYVAHNYAEIENHYGENVWVHRKGATLARKGTVGIIPGSQGTFSYIVEGLGNPESFMSCSHGAGRKMSRTKAIAELDLQEEIKKMDGIVHGIRNQKDLDEAAGSYKDIKSVMEQQKNLVKVLVELKPLGVVKG